MPGSSWSNFIFLLLLTLLCDVTNSRLLGGDGTDKEVSTTAIDKSATTWVGLQALTAFFIIVAAIAFAMLVRPLVHTNLMTARQYQPI